MLWLWQGVTLQTHQTCLNVNTMGHSHFKLFVNNKSSSKKSLQCFYQSYTWNINILWLTNKVLKLHRLSLINFNHWSLFLFFNISFSLWFTQWKKTSDKFPECFAQSEAFRRDCMRQKHLENDEEEFCTSSNGQKWDFLPHLTMRVDVSALCRCCFWINKTNVGPCSTYFYNMETWKHTTHQTVSLTMNTS